MNRFEVHAHSDYSNIRLLDCINPIEKLILFGSPCIRFEEELPLHVKLLKKLKQLPGMNEFGEYMKQYIRTLMQKSFL